MAVERCIQCDKESEIPAIRDRKLCDECIENEIKQIEAEDKIRQQSAYLKASRIPERYWGFDLSKLEISRTEFERLILSPDSILISGDIGTGKTNLACQILMKSRGRFYTINEIYQFEPKGFDWIKNEGLICIDDLSKTSFARVADKIFDIINTRYNANKKTIITTDKRLDELAILMGTEYGSAIISRLREWCVNKIQLKKKWRQW